MEFLIRLLPLQLTYGKMTRFLIILALLLCCRGRAQNYSIEWSKIAGGGGTSGNGQYSISCTIGQHDAGDSMVGGNYSLTGGFWAWVSVVQTPGAPALFINHSGSIATVYWQNVSGWSLQQNMNPAASSGWSVNTNWTTSNGTNYLKLMSPMGNFFFRLSQP